MLVVCVIDLLLIIFFYLSNYKFWSAITEYGVTVTCYMTRTQ